jgi:hypothetical protein
MTEERDRIDIPFEKSERLPESLNLCGMLVFCRNSAKAGLDDTESRKSAEKRAGKHPFHVPAWPNTFLQEFGRSD